MQHGGAAGPITVSTLAEAEQFAADGFRDITYAFPIAPEKLQRAADLAARIERLSVLLDSETALRAIEAFSAAHRVTFDVFLKVDCGYHRAGVDPESPDSARLAMRLGPFRGRAVPGTADARRPLVQRARMPKRSDASRPKSRAR